MSDYSVTSWIRKRENPFSRLIFTTAKLALRAQLPVIPGIHRTLYKLHRVISNLFVEGVSKLYWTPLFRSQLYGSHQGLHLAGTGMPLVTGPVKIELGDNCRLSSALTISGRTRSATTPCLLVGDNVGIGWQTTIAVGSRITFEDNVRIAGRSFFAGYPGHPLDAEARALGLPDLEEQVREIHLEKDVWLGTGVLVNGGVTIGRGTIVAAGSVVTKSLPAGVLAAGNPARVIRPLEPTDRNTSNHTHGENL